jgi:hypothetical protein
MRRHDLLEVLTRQPFRPFRLYVSDGAVYVIHHPDLLWVSPTAALIGVKEGPEPGPAIDQFKIVDLDHVTRVEHLEEVTSQ